MNDLVPNARLPKFIFYVKSALRGEERDYTSLNLNHAIFFLAVPMILEMLMESLFAVVDVYFVSKVSVNAVTTVGLTESVLMLIYAIAIGLSMSTTAMVSRRIGEKDKDGASLAAVQAILIGISVSVIVSIIGIIFAEDVLALMGASAEVIAEGSGYTRVMLGGNATIMLIFLINAVFRGAGDASIAMRSLWLANGLNIILDPLFIFGIGFFPEMGVTGAAIATTIGRGIGVLYQLSNFRRGKSIIKITLTSFRVHWETLVKLIRVSLGGIGQFIISTSSWIILVRIISEFGSDAVAGYTIAIRIIIFTILPAWGLSNAAATLVGQNLGAKEFDRAEKSVWTCGLYNMIFLGFISVIFIVFANELIRFFTPVEIVIQYGTDALRIISYGYIFYAYGMVIVQAFNGAGDTKTPTWINFLILWLIQIPLAYSLATIFEMQSLGVYIAISISESLLAVVGVLVFKRGKWKNQAI
ncbi:MAG: MATE family efflux transporter [Calditrichaeota bacterium]|nr:MATE family efflux transporter [Calditrichota bacterium]